MAVDAVVGGVQRAVLVPADRHVAAERGVADLAVRLDPIDAPALLAPEPVGVGEGTLVEAEIVGLVDLADPGVRRDRDQVPLGHRFSSMRVAPVGRAYGQIWRSRADPVNLPVGANRMAECPSPPFRAEREGLIASAMGGWGGHRSDRRRLGII